MAVPVLRTWTSGELATSAEMNSNLRDGGSFVLFPPYVFMTKNAPVSIPASTWTAVSWDAEMVDTDHMWANSPNPTRITASTTGRYDVQVSAMFAGPGAAEETLRAVQIRKNAGGSAAGGTQLIAASEVATNTAAWPASVHTSVWPLLTSGDYIEMFVWQSSSAALNLLCQTVGDMQTFCSAQWFATS
uniref:hypothetical protein n=1 Tax=Pseudonocardia sp. CA-138482 TaxID=3240023 RepID=UPI003F4980F1